MTTRIETSLNGWGALPLLLLIVVLTIPASATQSDYPKPAPDFSLPLLSGEKIAFSDLEGENILLVFGATWCPHCEHAMPVLETFARNFESAELQIIFISVREKTENVAKYARNTPPEFPICLDKTGLVAEKYGVSRIPTCVFIDSKRRIQYLGRPIEDIIWRLLSGERPIRQTPPKHSMRSAERRNQDPPGRAKRPTDRGKKTRRFIVELDEPPTRSRRISESARRARRDMYKKSAEKIGARIIHNYGRLKNKIVLEIPEDKIENLAELPQLRSIKEDPPVRALLEDSVYQIKADYGWDNAITGQGVKVCVVDTGVDHTHPDLANKVIAQYDSTGETTDAMDDNGHGTHVAGIIASEGLVYRGVSYDASIMAAKVLDYSGNGHASDVILGINWCVEQGADVINLSLGEGLYSDTCDDTEMAKAVNEAVDSGAVVVCASGNDGDANRIVSPACASKVIAVGAVDKAGQVTSYSDGGVELDIVAPGGDQVGGKNFPEIASTYSTEVANNAFYCMYRVGDDCYDTYFLVEGDRYIRAVGTSMATPHVAGAAALMLEENPDLTPAQVKAALEENADDLGAPGWDNIYGWGLINLERTLDNLPSEPAELKTRITEPNAADSFYVNQPFALAATVDCLGGDGCGQVSVHAQYCPGQDCNDAEFIDMNEVTAMATPDNNPNDLGVLSGCTVDTPLEPIFDVQTTLDVSESLYSKLANPQTALVGSVMPGTFSTGDLEPGDGIGAIGQNAQQLYEFEIPAGNVKKISVRLENYLVMHFDYPPFAGWYVYTSDAAGNNLNLIGDCVPAEGGGGEPQPSDCWFVSEDPNVLNDLNPGGSSYIHLVSHDVGENDWLTFNDIEVIVEYQIDPDNDEVHRYYLQFDISSIDRKAQLSDARLKLNVARPAEDGVAQVYLADDSLTGTETPLQLHEPNQPSFTALTNPIKNFTTEDSGQVSLNVKAALQEALENYRTTIAFQVRELNADQLFTLDAKGAPVQPVLQVSQKLESGCPGQNQPTDPTTDPNNGPRPLLYDTLVVKDVSEDAYGKYDAPALATVGASFAAEYRTGDLESRDGIGAIGENAEQLYEFEIPEGVVSRISVRLENYMVVHFDYPPFATWNVYTSDAAGNNLNFIGECTPAEGGGGEPTPPDCWFISEDPNVLNNLNPGGTNYIKLYSTGVGDNDWLTFNDIEVIVEYQVDPNNDSVSRYYVSFDLAGLTPDLELDSAVLNLNVNQPAAEAVAEVHLVDNYDPATGSYTIYNAKGPAWSSLANPIKTFSADTAGARRVNVKPAVEDAVQSGKKRIGFLITEYNEDTVFSLDASSSTNSPALEVYIKSEISGGAVKWNVNPLRSGRYTLRVLARNTADIVGLSDRKVVDIYDPNLPLIKSVQCLIEDVWTGCDKAGYGDTIQKIRVEADDPQEIPQVRLSIKNVPDDHEFLNETIPQVDGYFTKDLNLRIADSGQWRLEVVCTDSDSNIKTMTVNWLIPWGKITTSLMEPTTNITVPKNGSFEVRAALQCSQAECPDVRGHIKLNDPVELVYDDGYAEDYGDLGSIDSFLAVQFTPRDYPAQLKTARFYVWDKTTYPFELNIWDDNGYAGIPGTPLTTPFTVDPVVSSSETDEVAWFDIDLSDRNIIIDSGSFYIGWRQLEEGKLNQVGFDNTGTLHQRTWAFLPSFGWFNLHDYCQFCSILPDYCYFCGNIMIRAIMSEPEAYSGDLPTDPTQAPFYIVEDYPSKCPPMKDGDICNLQFEVRAVGGPYQYSILDVLGVNNYSFDTDGSIKATITAPLDAFAAANLDAVGPVDFRDLAILLQGWLESSSPMPADTNGDDRVDHMDLAALAQYWLQSSE